MQHESTSVSKPIHRKRSNAKAPRSGKPNLPLNGKMDAIPLREIETMDTKSLYHLAMKDKEVAKMAEARLSETLVNARRILGLPHNYPAEKTFSYLDHLNQYRSYDTNGIRIDGMNWSKGKSTIIRNTTAKTPYEEWRKDSKLHRIGGPARVEWHDNGKLANEEWYKDGKLHRVGGPAKVKWHDSGKRANEEWYKDGKLHRVGEPAKVEWHDSGKRAKEVWYQEGKPLRINAAAIVEWHKNGKLAKEVWYQDGKLHRDGNPASASWYNNGKPAREEWYQDGKPHRINAAAIVDWHENGKPANEIWYQNGKLHRLDGPAVASWHDNGKSAREEWYQNDKCHRLDGAAKIHWYDNGIREEWYQNDKLHRDGAAAIIVWTNEGIKDEEKWYKNGKLHRVGDAAVTTWNNGILFEQKWFQNDKLHRLDGPAVINGWTPGGKWYIEGKEYSAVDFIPALRTYIYRPKWKKSFKLITSVTYLDKVRKSSRAEPGSMQWAYMMGQFQQSHGVGLPKELKNNCMNAGYYAYALVGDSTQPEEVLMVYTKDNLYYIASGMGLHVTKDMDKSELCSLISSATN
jgi:antitoxin component YwqK of YwqJK toxin-antitoxin module